MEETEWDRSFQRALEEAVHSLNEYRNAYRNGLDRTSSGRRLGAAYSALCALDRGIAKSEA